MVNNSDFSQRLEKVMEYYTLTATALAEELDFNRSTISHLISGRNKPSLDFVMKILARFPEVDLEWLVLGKGKFPSPGISSAKEDPDKSIEPLQTEIPQKTLDIRNPNKAEISEHGKEIDKIVFFYKDGTFMKYEST